MLEFKFVRGSPNTPGTPTLEDRLRYFSANCWEFTSFAVAPDGSVVVLLSRLGGHEWNDEPVPDQWSDEELEAGRRTTPGRFGAAEATR
jgi:hypothetical protein